MGSPLLSSLPAPPSHLSAPSHLSSPSSPPPQTSKYNNAFFKTRDGVLGEHVYIFQSDGAGISRFRQFVGAWNNPHLELGDVVEDECERRPLTVGRGSYRGACSRAV